jgi:electron transfer flavoprotein beta subunit
MDIIVVLRQVPDLVEEFELDPDGTDIDREFLKFVISEWDEYALEEALLAKEAVGGSVTAVALDDPDVDQSLYTALARGADRAVKLSASAEGWISSHRRAAVIASWIRNQPCDLVLTGVQSIEDLDGQLPMLLAQELGLPHAAVVVGVDAKEGTAKVTQELGGGRYVELEVPLPAVLGIQQSRQAPRYAPISRVRQAMQAGGLETAEADLPAEAAGLTLRRMYAPEAAGHAEMLEGSAEDVADRIIDLLRSRGLLG